MCNNSLVTDEMFISSLIYAIWVVLKLDFNKVDHLSMILIVFLIFLEGTDL